MLIPSGYEAITVNTVIGFTAGLRVPTTGFFADKPAWKVVCTLETDQIRFTVDGTTPTSSVGHLMSITDTLVLEEPHEIANFQAIKVTNNASLKVTYYHKA